MAWEMIQATQWCQWPAFLGPILEHIEREVEVTYLWKSKSLTRENSAIALSFKQYSPFVLSHEKYTGVSGF